MIIQNNDFRSLKEKHAKEMLEFLLNFTQEEFGILCTKEGITFNPPLPEHITSAFGDVIMFVLANYTLSSAVIEDDTLIFETGFGEENIGSVVSVPIGNIIQITQDETPLFVNVAATLPKPKEQNPFMLNPRNKKLLD
ncbi:MAG: hypothetical protein GXO62_08380 [Epsilonproteobacteria bacterium]|nr:hypothetical protein [Campylobacterota bacterium]